MPTETWTARADRRWLLAAGVLLLAAIWAVFHGAAGAEFLSWDDDINITSNPHVRGLTGENLRWMFTDTEYVRRYMPLGWLSWACQFECFGQSPFSYHLVNVLLHALSAVVLLLVLRRLLLLALPAAAREGRDPFNGVAAPRESAADRSAGLDSGTSAALSRGAATPNRNEGREWSALVCAGLASLLWAIHPLRVEPVAWASGRLYCQATMFLVFSVLAYLRYCESRAAGRPSRAWFWSSVAAYAASLLTYPLALGFVALLPLLDLYPLRRFRLSHAGLRSAEARQVLIEKVPYGVVVGLVFAVTLWARSGAAGLWRPPPTLAEFGVLDRVMQGFYVWASYLWRSIAPGDLSPVYTSLVQFDPLGGPFVASLLAIAGLSVLVASKWRQWPGVAVAWTCYLLILVPMLGLTEHPHYANDRYSYLPGLALAALVAGVLFTLWEHRAARVPALAVAGAAAIVCGLLTVTQVRAWRDTDALFLHIIAKLGDSPYRADTYCRLGNRRMAQGRWEEARQLFTDSTHAAPAFVPGYRGLGEALSRQGRTQEAVSVFLTALSVQPPAADLRVRTAEALADTGRYHEALQQYRAALDRTPGYGQAMNGLAWLLATCPEASLRDGAQAVALAEKIAESTDHRLALVEATLAAAYAEAGRFQEAIQSGERARALAMASGETNLVTRGTELLERCRRGQAYRQPFPAADGARP